MTTNPSSVTRGKTKSPVKDLAKQQASSLIRFKAIVRRLPPNLPEQVFWHSVQPWVSDETASWKVFYQGKLRKKLNKENIPSRAYVLFKNEEHLATFSREYDGHLFRDKQGNESQAVVEFAPNQKVPPEKKKVDSRHATIQQDEDYLSFIDSLQNPPIKLVEVDVDALLASTLPPEEPKTTPLLAALREQKHAAQEKKTGTAETVKTQLRKGGTGVVPPQKQEVTDAAPQTGKKGKKGKGGQTPVSVPTAPPVANLPSTKLSASGRSRPTPNQTPGPSTTITTSAAVPSSKETATIAEGESSQRRNRPMLGLQSRHLKAALSGAGVQMAPASPSSSSPASTISSTLPPAASPGSGTPAGAPIITSRGARGRGGEKRPSDQSFKESVAKESGNGRGGSGKEKGRSRHPPPPGGGQTPTVASGRPTDATPRILSREDPPPAVFNVNDSSAKDRAPTGASHDANAARGRGNRRGRGL
ncbi:hypothetical protein K439DRAFT_1661244 [Ramaria rubella]|nr:hypothetical protein K439DRAFT_1661244 [Ramaria rubella]